MNRGVRGGVVLGLGGLVLLAGCSSILPFEMSGPQPITNEAVVACKKAAEDQGYDDLGQQQVIPYSDGRYGVTMTGHGDNGWHQAICTYDPATGAHVPPQPHSS